MPTVEIVVGCAIGALIAARLPEFTVQRRPAISVVTGELADADDLHAIITALTRAGLDVVGARLIGGDRTGRPEQNHTRPS